MNCHQADELLSGLMDGELTPKEAEEVRAHLEECPRCRAELGRIQDLEGIMKRLTLPKLPDEAWDLYWTQVYNKLERRVGWFLAALGALLLAGYGMYELCKEWLRDPSVPAVVRVGCACLAVGVLVLVISTVREKIMTCRHDRYREIVR